MNSFRNDFFDFIIQVIIGSAVSAAGIAGIGILLQAWVLLDLPYAYLVFPFLSGIWFGGWIVLMAVLLPVIYWYRKKLTKSTVYKTIEKIFFMIWSVILLVQLVFLMYILGADKYIAIALRVFFPVHIVGAFILFVLIVWIRKEAKILYLFGIWLVSQAIGDILSSKLYASLCFWITFPLGGWLIWLVSTKGAERHRVDGQN